MEVTALDEAGKKVDWFFIYKVPQLAEGATTDKTTGYEYVYYDSSIDQQPTVSNRNILKSPYVLNSDQGALNKTLDSVFNNPGSTTGWILYNDETTALSVIPRVCWPLIPRRRPGIGCCIHGRNLRSRRRKPIRHPSMGRHIYACP
jgi:hypothetical protein